MNVDWDFAFSVRGGGLGPCILIPILANVGQPFLLDVAVREPNFILVPGRVAYVSKCINEIYRLGRDECVCVREVRDELRVACFFLDAGPRLCE